MGPEERAAFALSIAGPCLIAAILCVTLARWFMALRRNSVIQSRPPPVRLPNTPAHTRRDSRASSVFDSKSPIDDYDDDLEMGGRRAGETVLHRGIGSKRDMGSKTTSKPAGLKKASKVEIDIELGAVVDNNSNNPYMGHYNLKRPRPTTHSVVPVVDYSKRLEVDLVKSSLSLPTLDYSPR